MSYDGISGSDTRFEKLMTQVYESHDERSSPAQYYNLWRITQLKCIVTTLFDNNCRWKTTRDLERPFRVLFFIVAQTQRLNGTEEKSCFIRGETGCEFSFYLFFEIFTARLLLFFIYFLLLLFAIRLYYVVNTSCLPSTRGRSRGKPGIRNHSLFTPLHPHKVTCNKPISYSNSTRT